MRDRPLVVVTVLYAIGLALGSSAARRPLVFASVVFLSAVTVAVAAWHERSRLRWLLPIATVTSGSLWFAARSGPRADDVAHYVHHPRVRGHTVRLRGTVMSDLDESGSGKRFYLETQEVAVGSWSAPTSGVTAVHTGTEFEVKPGAIVETKAWLREPPAASNVGQTSRQWTLACQQVFSTAIVPEDAQPVPLARARKLGAALWAVQLRRRMLERTRDTMPPPYNDLAARLLFSIAYGLQVTPLPEEVVESFRTAGVIHVLVVSGSQVAFFFLLMRVLARRVPRRSATAWVLFAGALGLLAFYYLLCSAPPTRIPSLTRATLMATLVGAGALLARDVDNLTSLAAAALVLLVADPNNLHNSSFQLSFAAVLGITLLTGPIATTLRLGASGPAQLVAASLGAQLLTAPLVAHYFGRLSLIGLVSNIFIVPLAAALIPLGFIGSVVSLWSQPLAAAINSVNYHLTLLTWQLASFFASVPHASLNVARWSALEVAFFYGAVALAAAAAVPAARAQVKVERLLVAAVLLSTLFIAHVFAGTLVQPLEITVLDVGDGDCLFVRSPVGKTMLIDAGTRQNPDGVNDVGGPKDVGIAERVVLPFLLTRHVTRLDCVVLTHPHDDHMSGLPAVLRRLPVGLLLDAGESVHAPHYEAVLDIVRHRRIPYRIARRGQRFNLGGGVHAFVMTPLEPRLRGTHSDLNNNAIAIKIVYQQFSALLAADLEQEAEARLLQHGDRLPSTMLKAGHHGSKTSSTAEFLRAVRPAVTLISCGPSTFIHPAPETLARLAAARTRVYRTDLHGALTVRSQGTRYQVSTFKDGVMTDWTDCPRF